MYSADLNDSFQVQVLFGINIHVLTQQITNLFTALIIDKRLIGDI